jgi:hypothetical protein
MKKLFVIFASIALVAAFAVTASAADWSLYGNARMATFMTDDDPGGTAESVEDLRWDLQGNSRVGATVKNENISARFEYGTGINLRRLYGVYDFGGWGLKIGQDYTPVAQFISGQVFDSDLGLLGNGTAYGSRRPQIAGSFGPLTIALIQPTSGLLTDPAKVLKNSLVSLVITVVTTAGTVVTDFSSALPSTDMSGTVEETLPKLEASYGFKTDMFFVNLIGGYQTFEINDRLPGEKDIDVDSYMFGVDGGVNFGAAYVKAAWSMYSNGGSAGWYQAAPATLNSTGTDTDDNDTMMYALVAGFKASDTMSFEAGYGYREYDSDVAGAKDDEETAYYVQGVFQVAPGVFIIPEVGTFDRDDDAAGADEGDLTYFGAKWQINF